MINQANDFAYYPGQHAVNASPIISYLSNLAPLLLAFYNEGSGNLLDYGSENADGTPAAVTQGASAIAGVGSYDFNGVNSIVVLDNADIPNVENLTTLKLAFLLDIDTLGGGGRGHILSFGPFQSSNYLQVSVSSTTRISASMGLSTTNAVSQLEYAAGLLNTEAWLFLDYDDADARGNGRVWSGWWYPAGGVLNAMTTPAETVGAGTVDAHTTDLNIGGDAANARIYDGRIAAHFVNAGLWSTSDMNAIGALL